MSSVDSWENCLHEVLVCLSVCLVELNEFNDLMAVSSSDTFAPVSSCISPGLCGVMHCVWCLCVCVCI